MNDENLIPITSRDPRQIKEMAKKGGSVCSVKKKVAARLRELKKKGALGDEQAKLIASLVETKELNSVEIYKLVVDVIANAKTDEQKRSAAELMIKASESQHPKSNKVQITADLSTNIVHFYKSDEHLDYLKKIDNKLNSMSRSQREELVLEVAADEVED